MATVLDKSGNSPASVAEASKAKAHVLKDGITAPATVSGLAQLYVDSADGDLKVKFGDGFVATVAADS